jgi:hypothetical protein
MDFFASLEQQEHCAGDDEQVVMIRMQEDAEVEGVAGLADVISYHKIGRRG